MPEANGTAEKTPQVGQVDFDLAAIQAIHDPIQRLRVIMKRLLGPGGCPWDREQTHQTLRQYTLEEAHEVAEAIDEGDDGALCEELGDLGLQVVFHAELAEGRGAFAIEDVYKSICDKLIRRHPHVFAEASAENSAEVLKNWELLKNEEKREKAARQGEERAESAISGVPRSLPALQRAARLQEKAARVGFDWDRIDDVKKKVREEVEEFLEHTPSHLSKSGAIEATEAKGHAELHVAMTEEFGDLLFALVNLARFVGLRPEEALGAACAKFTRRFASIEEAAENSGKSLKDMTLEQMDALWDEVKRNENHKEKSDTNYPIS